MDEPRNENDQLVVLLKRSVMLDEAMLAAVGIDDYRLYDRTSRIVLSFAAASVALEHGRALRSLIVAGLPTSALAILRLQHEALTRAVWLLYAASEPLVEKLAAPLSVDTAAAARRVPTIGQMLHELAACPTAAPPLEALMAFREHNADATNSLVHTGIHALQRAIAGYPIRLACDSVRNSNGLALVTVMTFAVLSGRRDRVRNVGQLQAAFADVLPDLK